MPTTRENMIAFLEAAPRPPKQLAALMHMGVRDTLDHLEHVYQSTEDRFEVTPAECLGCGFTFDTRDKLGTPSRCLECRQERIKGPWCTIRPEE